MSGSDWSRKSEAREELTPNDTDRLRRFSGFLTEFTKFTKWLKALNRVSLNSVNSVNSVKVPPVSLTFFFSRSLS